MARVLFYTGVCLLAVSAALLYLPTYFSFIIAFLSLLFLFFLIIFHKKIKVNGLKTLTFIVLIFTLLGIYTHEFQIKPAEGLVDCKAEIVGTVCEFPNIYDTYSVYTVETERITIIAEEGKQPQNVPQKLKISIFDSNTFEADVFDKLRLTVRFNDLDIYRNSSLSNKIYASCYTEKFSEHLGQNRPFYAPFYDLRTYINKLLYRNMDFGDASVISAFLLGERDNLDPDFEGDAKTAGIIHMLVVSGMHLGIIFQLLSRIFSMLKVHRIITQIIMLGAIFSMAAICGFTPSILRASLTYLIIVIGNLLFRKPDSLNSLGAATIIILFFNPLGFGNLALLLSLLSTFGILFICPILEETILSFLSSLYSVGRVTKIIVFSLSQTLSATLATMPVCILSLGYISIIAPIANLLLGYAATLLTAIAFLTVILFFLPSALSFLSIVPTFLLSVLVKYIVKITDICAEVEWAAVPALNEYLISLGIFLLIIPALMLAKKFSIKPKFRITMKSFASAMVLISVSSAVFFYGISPKNEIAVPDIGKGSSVIIKTENTVMAIGTGDTPTDYNKIENYMYKMCRRKIDHIIIPTTNNVFAAGAYEMILKNTDASVIYPKLGKHTERIDLISNENFKKFDYKIRFNTADAEVITIATIGTTVNFSDRSVVIYTGIGEIDSLFDECKFEEPLLICTDNLKKLPECKISECIITGNKESKLQIAALLKKQNIEHTIVNSKIHTVKF